MIELTTDQLFLLPFLGHFALVAGLYVWLTWERQTALRKGEIKASAFVNANADPERSKRVARNLSNQFELPVFALFAAAIIYQSGRIEEIDIAAAWLFLVGRLIHTVVQTLTTDVPLRGMVFMINFIAVVVLMGRVAQGVFL
ncbi:MAPEG family protein [Asticcacaulis sp. AND118]|uniref:MAPEG family protein n=1 Tax=Asticcacaulis sp. AND118 TaxID=2840468 RepID=UPI001CFFABD6|nr:MAPEG family protein [Asticcacaulis sp. AND118]UDF04165.1 MAPEG family protein [Asticcacaulis sp. AND118]